jgi:hypothetical protein
MKRLSEYFSTVLCWCYLVADFIAPTFYYSVHLLAGSFWVLLRAALWMLFSGCEHRSTEGVYRESVQ